MSHPKRWRAFHTFEIRDPDTDELYLRRYILLRCPWFEIFVHRIHTPDTDRHLHDHPWSFVSFVLRGWYIETVPEPVSGLPLRFIQRTWFNYKRATDRHRITLVSPNLWTLILTGPRRREWGFVVDGVWVHYREYLGHE